MNVVHDAATEGGVFFYPQSYPHLWWITLQRQIFVANALVVTSVLGTVTRWKSRSLPVVACLLPCFPPATAASRYRLRLQLNLVQLIPRLYNHLLYLIRGLCCGCGCGCVSRPCFLYGRFWCVGGLKDVELLHR